jgi:hypothetical protein
MVHLVVLTGEDRRPIPKSFQWQKREEMKFQFKTDGDGKWKVNIRNIMQVEKRRAW